jgi:membrane-associated phospholipid phosphatase
MIGIRSRHEWRAADAGGRERPEDPDAASDVRGLRSRNERIVRVALGAYVALLSLVAIDDGVRLTPDVAFVVGGLLILAAAWRWSHLRGWPSLRDWAPFVTVALAYELIRVVGPVLIRNVHIGEILAVERSLLDGHVGSELLQAWLRPAGAETVGLIATAFYVAHSVLPIVIAAIFWRFARRTFYDFLAAFVLLSLAAFATYILLPVAPPWWAAAAGHLIDAAGRPLVGHLEGGALQTIVASAGLNGHALSALAFGDISPDPVAAFPSLHAAYPFLAYLFVRQVSHRAAWVMLAYTVAVWFSIVYLGDHYVVDIAGGILFATVAWAFVARPMGWRGLVPQLARP